MKKIIITIIAITAMMNLVSCKSESETTITSHTIGENYITETIIEEDIVEENIITETVITENHMSDAEYNWLIDQYYEGNIELDVLKEMLFTGHCTKY